MFQNVTCFSETPFQSASFALKKSFYRHTRRGSICNAIVPPLWGTVVFLQDFQESTFKKPRPKGIDKSVRKLDPTLPRLRNHNAIDDDNVDFRSFQKSLNSKLGKLMQGSFK